LAKVSASTTYYTSHAIARLVRVSPSTVLSWIDKGLLPAHRTPGGHRRVEASTLVRFLRDNQMPVPRELLNVSTLLVVDDDVMFLRSIERLLKLQAPELTVETADSAVDGLLKVGTIRPDAVLLDAYMPGMNGVEVCRRLNGSTETRHILVLAVTGHPSEEVLRDFREAGAAQCFTKPVDVAAVLAALGWPPAAPVD
jgi:excisionase family DNA binding protein